MILFKYVNIYIYVYINYSEVKNMKRIFGAILILIIVALFISVHAYQPLNNVLSSGIEVISLQPFAMML